MEISRNKIESGTQTNIMKALSKKFTASTTSKNQKLTGIDALLKNGRSKNPLARSMSKILGEKGMLGTSMFKTSFSGNID